MLARERGGQARHSVGCEVTQPGVYAPISLIFEHKNWTEPPKKAPVYFCMAYRS